MVVDINGIFKADIGIKDGLIHKIGKSGNPDTQPQIDIIIGPGTEIIAGEGKIITAGGQGSLDKIYGQFMCWSLRVTRNIIFIKKWIQFFIYS